jgi:hypothetical protein
VVTKENCRYSSPPPFLNLPRFFLCTFFRGLDFPTKSYQLSFSLFFCCNRQLGTDFILGEKGKSNNVVRIGDQGENCEKNIRIENEK